MKKFIGIFIIVFVLFFAFGCNPTGTGTDQSTTGTDQSTTGTITQLTSIRIIFETNGGNDIDDVIITAATLSLDVPTPTKLGFNFIGWYTDSDLTVPFGDC